MSQSERDELLERNVKERLAERVAMLRENYERRRGNHK